jgi:membrane protein YdbS with pleckstrin-like domain
MGTVTFSRPRTKTCQFCGAGIQGRAIKCRFCAEFLNTDEAKALEGDSGENSRSSEDEKPAEKVLFEGRPSLFGLIGAAIKGLVFLGVAGFLVAYPLEELSVFQVGESSILAGYEEPADEFEESEFVARVAEELGEIELAENTAEETSWLALDEGQVLLFRKCRIIAGLGLAALVLSVFLMKVVKLKMTYYEVTVERIEWSRGILDRKVDNLDMFRVVDLKLRRSLLDCMLGIGTVGLITTDKTDPEFTFEKMRHSRRLYDTIKKASLAADRRDGVIHIE